MERIKDALAYFQENNPQDVEFSRLVRGYEILSISFLYR